MLRRRVSWGLLALLMTTGSVVAIPLGTSGAASAATTFGSPTCYDCNAAVESSAGVVYATDETADRVDVFASDGTFLTSWGNADLQTPAGIDLDGSGNVYVLDAQRGVVEFTSAGTYIRSLGPGCLDSMAVSPAGTVYVHSCQGQYEIYDSAGANIGGSSGSNYDIDGLTYDDANGDLYAVDYVDDDIEILDGSDLQLLGTFGSHGVGSGQFANVDSITSDPQGNIYVSDGGVGVIKQLSAAGIQLATYPAPGYTTTFSDGALLFGNGPLIERIDTVAPSAYVSASSSSVAVGESVSFDASSSTLPFGSIIDFRWDLDGSGAFAIDSGTTPSASTTFATAGPHVVTVKVTGSSGQSATSSVTITVNPPAATTTTVASPAVGTTTTTAPTPTSPIGTVGVTIDGGDYATDTLHVALDLVWPSGSATAQISNTPDFSSAGATRVVTVAPEVSWTLAVGGKGRQPKSVYVRFAGRTSATTTYSDHIIYDNGAPSVLLAKLVTGPSASTSHAARSATSGRDLTYRIAVRATDAKSGISAISTSTRTSGGTVTTLHSLRVKGALSLNAVISVTSAASPKYLRVRSAAGTWSRWAPIVG